MFIWGCCRHTCHSLRSWIHLENISPLPPRETTFATSCLLPYAGSPFRKGFTLKSLKKIYSKKDRLCSHEKQNTFLQIKFFGVFLFFLWSRPLFNKEVKKHFNRITAVENAPSQLHRAELTHCSLENHKR